MRPTDPVIDEDPWAVLGLTPEADDEQIRAAYLRCVKEHPPEQTGGQFERIRDAYDLLRDPGKRRQRMLLWANPQAALSSLLPERERRRRFVGPSQWLAVVRGEK